MSESKAYKAKLNKKVKDMSPEEKKEYGRLRTKDSRAKGKATTAPKKEEPKKKKIKIKKANDGNIPNKKLKCFMLKAKNGATYKTCAKPEGDKQPKKQVRGKPRPADKRVKPIVRAYPSDADRKTAAKGRGKKARAEKSGNMTATKADGSVVVIKKKKTTKQKEDMKAKMAKVRAAKKK